MLDVTDAPGCERVMADLELDALVNNAGYALTGAIEDITDAEAQQLFDTMVFAPMRLARLALPVHASPRRRSHRQHLVDRRAGQLPAGRLVHRARSTRSRR